MSPRSAPSPRRVGGCRTWAQRAGDPPGCQPKRLHSRALVAAGQPMERDERRGRLLHAPYSRPQLPPLRAQGRRGWRRSQKPHERTGAAALCGSVKPNTARRWVCRNLRHQYVWTSFVAHRRSDVWDVGELIAWHVQANMPVT